MLNINHFSNQNIKTWVETNICKIEAFLSSDHYLEKKDFLSWVSS